GDSGKRALSEVRTSKRAWRKVLHGVRSETGACHLRELSGGIESRREVLHRVRAEGPIIGGPIKGIIINVQRVDTSTPGCHYGNGVCHAARHRTRSVLEWTDCG